MGLAITSSTSTSLSNLIRKSKRAHKGSNRASEVKKAQRVRGRQRKAAGESVNLDLHRRIRSRPPKTVPKLYIPEFFMTAPDRHLFTNDLLLKLVNYLHLHVYSNVCGADSICIVWSNELDGKTIGLLEDVASSSNPSTPFRISIWRLSVLTKELISVVVGHKLALCVVAASSSCSHTDNGNAFQKALEELHRYDPYAVWYNPAG